MVKKPISTIRIRNKKAENIIKAVVKRKSFLICGHKDPDEDCVASMVAFAILLTKFDKIIEIYIDGHVNANLNYLLNICKFNSIDIIDSKSKIKRNIDTIVICDTAKKSMLDVSNRIKPLFDRKEIIKIEIDHHIGGDSQYIGDTKYSLVDEASSASELVGFLALKLRNQKEILDNFFILDPFSRNFILAVLTGIVADTNMGQYLKSKREKVYYNIFSKMYNEMLMQLTVKESNLNKIEDVSDAIHIISMQEEKCNNYILERRQSSNSIGYVILTESDMNYILKKFDYDVLITVIKHIADKLAEESGKASLVVFYDSHGKKPLYQFRMRRSRSFKKYDLRHVLDAFRIADGGGHEGAIGFRFSAEGIDDIQKYTEKLISGIEQKIGNL